MSRAKFSIGHAVLFFVAAAFMAVNATLLHSTQKKVATEKKDAEEAAKPAKLEITVLSATECAECFDVNILTSSLKGNEKIEITSEQAVDYTSEEGNALLAKYQITKVPTVLVKGDVAKAFDVTSFVQNLGKTAEDGTLVVTNVPPPYFDVATGQVKGKFTLTFITDKNCKECYDPTLHRRALAGLAMQPSSEKFVDRLDAEGKRLVASYTITSVPTILLQGELNEYQQFSQVWPTVGTVEKDGTHVFRAGQVLMGAYHDLKTGKVVEPPKPEEQIPGEEIPPAAPADH